jgi:hypothetical protein
MIQLYIAIGLKPLTPMEIPHTLMSYAQALIRSIMQKCLGGEIASSAVSANKR